MGSGFLDELRAMMEGEERFEARPRYDPYGDCLVFHASEEAGYADRIDGVLTLFRSMDTEKVIGFQVKGVHAILQKFGFDGMAVAAEGKGEHVHKVTVSGLLFLGIGESEVTRDRQMAYAEASSLFCEPVEIQPLALV